MTQRKRTKVKKPIKSTTETAFQRAILLKETSDVEGIGTIKWLDIELPVNKGRKSGRGNCVDLIGKSSSGYVLCELKLRRGEYISDDPGDAVNELRGYCVQISENWQELETLNLHHPDCEDFLWKDIAMDINNGHIIKIVAADEGYWRYWREKQNECSSDKLQAYKNQGFILCSIDIDEFCFEKQKGDKETYTPSIETNYWTVLK